MAIGIKMIFIVSLPTPHKIRLKIRKCFYGMNMTDTMRHTNRPVANAGIAICQVRSGVRFASGPPELMLTTVPEARGVLPQIASWFRRAWYLQENEM